MPYNINLSLELLFAFFVPFELLLLVNLQLCDLVLEPLVRLAQVHEAHVQLAHCLQLPLLRRLALRVREPKLVVLLLEVVELIDFELEILLQDHISALQLLYFGSLLLFKLRKFFLLIIVALHEFLNIVLIKLVPEILYDYGILVLLLLVDGHRLLQRLHLLLQLTVFVLECSHVRLRVPVLVVLCCRAIRRLVSSK